MPPAPSPSDPFPPLFHVIYCKRLGLLRLGVSIHNNNNNGAGIAQLVVHGLAVHGVVGSILLWGHFPVEGIFPLELTHLAPDRPLSPARTVLCQIADRPRSTARHVATTNAAIAVVVNDILGRLTVTFSAFSALSSRIFCSKIEHV